MNPLLPTVKARDVVRVAKKFGFEFDRQSGSHAVYYRKSDKRRIVVPVHPAKDIKPKTLFSIIKDMGIEPEDFKKLALNSNFRPRIFAFPSQNLAP